MTKRRKRLTLNDFQKKMAKFKEYLNQVKAFVFDVDGVLADEQVVVLTDGKLGRLLNAKDGYAMREALKAGYPIGIITGASNPLLRQRFLVTGVHDLYFKSKDKLEDIHHFMNKHGLKPEEVLFMGDDIPDIAALKAVGVPVAPANAAPEVKALALYISDKDGGKGCVRDILEQVLKAQGKWPAG